MVQDSLRLIIRLKKRLVSLEETEDPKTRQKLYEQLGDISASGEAFRVLLLHVNDSYVPRHSVCPVVVVVVVEAS